MTRKLDEELAQALSENGAGGEPSSTPAIAAAVRPEPRKQGRNIGLLVTLLVMVGAVVCLFLMGFQNAAVYAIPVDQLLHQGDRLVNKKVRIEAELVLDTLEKRDNPCEYRFYLRGASEGDKLLVRYPQCVIPDTFVNKPGVMATVEGSLTSKGDFEATLVMAKCSSKYDPKTHQMDDKRPGS
jgi:cytochrome c-type biogenesis protein CcmE